MARDIGPALKELTDFGSGERYAGHHEAAAHVFEMADVLARRYGSTRTQSDAAAWQGNLLYHCRRYRSAETWLRIALDLRKRHRDRGGVFKLLRYDFANLYRDRGEYGRYLQCIKRALAIKNKGVSRTSRGFAYCLLADAYLRVGRLDAAMIAARRARSDYAASCCNSALSMTSWTTLGDCLVAQGDLVEAVNAYARVHIIAESTPHVGPIAARTSSVMTACLLLLGKSGEARRCAKAAPRWAKGSKADPIYREHVLLSQAYVEYASGRIEAAHKRTDDILDLASARPVALTEAVCCLRGWCALLRNDTMNADRAARDAMAASKKCHPVRQTWQAFDLLSHVHRSNGRHQAAQRCRDKCVAALANGAQRLSGRRRKLYDSRPDRLIARAGEKPPLGFLMH